MDFGLDYQGGGGFGGDSRGGGGFGGASQSSGGRNSSSGGNTKPRRNYDEQTLLPVVASMVLSATDDGDGSGTLALPDGRKLHQIKLVGAVRSVEDFSTNVVYEIEDGTGLVEVKQWLDDQDCTAITELRHQTLKEHVYVSIIGAVKEYDGRKTVIADAVRPLSTGNQLTHHLLEVVHAGELYQRKESILPGGGISPMMGIPLAPTSHGGGSSHMTGVNLFQSNSGSGGDGMRDAVLAMIRDGGSRSDMGASVVEVVQRLAGRFREGDIREVIGGLCAEGHIYSTVDDDHFKVAI